MRIHHWEPSSDLGRSTDGMSHGNCPAPRRRSRPVPARVALTAAAFDAVPAETAILAPDGTVLAVNRAWRLFGAENGAGPTCGPGADYLDVTRRAAAGGDDTAAVVLAALEAVLAGGATRASVDYPCHAPHEQHWFRVAAERLPGRQELLVTHRELARCGQPDEESTQTGSRSSGSGTALP